MIDINFLLNKIGVSLHRLSAIPGYFKSNLNVDNGVKVELNSSIVDNIINFYLLISLFYEGMNCRQELLTGMKWKSILTFQRRNQIDLIIKQDKHSYKKLLENMFFNELIDGLWNFRLYSKGILEKRLNSGFLSLCQISKKILGNQFDMVALNNGWRLWGGSTINGTITHNSPDHAL